MASFKISIYEFRLKHKSRGKWSAQVYLGGRWENVIYPRGEFSVVTEPSEPKMLRYLEYAYGDKKWGQRT